MIPVFSFLQLDFAHTSIWQPIIDSGFLGLDSHLLLTDHTVSNGNVVYKVVVKKGKNVGCYVVSQVYSNVEFVVLLDFMNFIQIT